MPPPGSPLVFDGASLATELHQSVDRKSWRPASPVTPTVPLQKKFLEWMERHVNRLEGRRRLGFGCVSEQPSRLKQFCRDYGLQYEPPDSGTVALSAIDLTIRWDHEVTSAEIARHDTSVRPTYIAYEAVRIPRTDAKVYEYLDGANNERYTIAKIHTGHGYSLWLTAVPERPKSVVDLLLQAQELQDASSHFVPTDSYYSVVVPTVRCETTTKLGWAVGMHAADNSRQLSTGIQKYSISLGNHSDPHGAPPPPMPRWPRDEPRVALRFAQPLFGWFALDDLPVVQAPFYLPTSTWKQLPLPTRRS